MGGRRGSRVHAGASAPVDGPGAGPAPAAARSTGSAEQDDAFATLEAVPDAMVVVEADRIVFVNRAAEALFGYAGDELVGRPLEVLVPGLPREHHAAHRAEDARHPASRPMGPSMDRPTGSGLDLRARRRDGTEIPVDVSLSSIEMGARTVVAAAVRDVSEQRQLVERHQAVSEMISDLACEFTVAPDGALEISWATDSFAKVLGYRPGDLQGFPGWTGSSSVPVHPDDVEGAIAAVSRILEGEDVEVGPIRVVTRTGEDRWLRAWARPLETLPDGRVRGIAAAQDVTDRVATRRALEVSEERLRAAQAVARVGSWTIDLETHQVETSAELLRIHGFDGRPSTMPADDLIARVHPDDRPEFVERMARSFETGEPVALDCRIVREGGAIRWIESRTHPVVDDSGRMVAFHGTTQDVTQFREATRALAESEARLREAQAIAHLGHWHRDLATGVIEWSDEMYAIIGVDPGHFEPTIDRFLGLVHPDDRQVFGASVAESIDRREPAEYEYRVIRPDGSVRWLASRGQPVFDADGEVSGYRGISQDVTERKEAEERYRAVSELTSDVAYSYHVEESGQPIIDWTTAGIEELTGYTTDELDFLGGWRQILHPDDVAAYDARTLRVLRGESVTEEFRIFTKSGDERWLSLSARPLADPAGNIFRVFGAATDVTDRKEAERALALSEARLREAQSVGHVGSWTWDVDRDAAEWSSEIVRLFGVAPGEAPTTLAEFLDLVRVDARPGIVTTLDQAVETGEAFEGDFPIIRPDGETRWLLARGRARYRGTGRVRALVGTLLDITERREAEERHRAISELISDAAYAFRIENGHVYPEWITESWCRITGYTGEEPLMLLARWREYVHPDDQHLLLEGTERALAGQPDVTEYRLTTKSGEIRWIRAFGRPVTDPGTGRVTRIYGAAQDVTAERRVEAALRRAYEREHAAVERLRATDRLKDEFLATASHELRTPLTSIVGFASALARQHEALDPVTRAELIEKLERNALDLGGMIERLLDFSRLESGSVDVDLRPISLEDAFEQSLDFHGVDVRDHEVVVDLPPDAVVIADRPGLLHVLNNLMSNAAKYSPAGSTIEVSAHRSRARDDGDDGGDRDVLVVRVTDQGIGVDPAIQEQVFERFYRGPNQPAGTRGTGIGLAIAASYVELMGGSIGVDSRPGEGASFWVILPAARAGARLGSDGEGRGDTSPGAPRSP